MKILAFIIPIIFILTSCGKSDTPEQKTVFAMDTSITMTVYGNNAANALTLAQNEIKRLDTLLSRSDENGEIYPLNLSGSKNVSKETSDLIKSSLDICRDTNGAFDITIAPIMDAWGFFGHKYRVPSKNEIDEQLLRVGYDNVDVTENTITLRNGAMLDLGGVAKGYAIDCVTEILNDNKIESALVSFGSAISAIGTKPDGSKWNIGIMHPQNRDNYIAKIQLENQSVSTSGSYEQFFEENGKKYHHIINPSTGYPTDNSLTSVTVMCDSATRADALSTALFVMGYDVSVEYWQEKQDFEMVLITDDNTIYYTENMDIEEHGNSNIIMIKSEELQ